MLNKRINTLLLWLSLVIAITSCRQNERNSEDANYYNVFVEIQMNHIFSDSKTFLDCVPIISEDSIVILYNKQKNKSDFDLKSFVHKNYRIPTYKAHHFTSDTTVAVNQHIQNLWDILTRKDTLSEGSLLPLPYPYVVPGGRFNEIYYWDSYFTMLGLEADNRTDLIESMVANFASLIRHHGFIPNGNRSYFLTRSQPPFFSLMVELLAKLKGNQILINYLPELKKEYSFWMNGMSNLNESYPAHYHVVLIAEGQYLNRYWDKADTPRPESFREDSLIATKSNQNYRTLYRNIRSACESGWDFSSRWFKDNESMATIQTTNILPVDLNVLLWNLEKLIAMGSQLAKDSQQAILFKKKADTRRKLINKVFWNHQNKFFMDYNYIEKRHTSTYSLAGVFPLFARLATPQQAEMTAKKIEKEFLHPYGLVTTLTETGEQWDYPNGWAPLHWITIRGLEKYDYHYLAEIIARRWMKGNIEGYRKTGKLVEKYDVVNGVAGRGGEYPTQDGFGWTNGVLQKLLIRYPNINELFNSYPCWQKPSFADPKTSHHPICMLPECRH